MITMKYCGLCRTNQADKTNSHIFPRFLCQSLLDNGTFNRAITIIEDSERPLFDQDSPKENYILCSECESLLDREYENYFASEVLKRLDNQKEYFNVRVKDFNYRTYYRIDYVLFKKFVYSLVFRAHISELPLFKDFCIPNDCSEEIRCCLLNDNYFIDYPLYIFTCRDNVHLTGNQILAEHIINQIFNLHVNEFIFIIDFDDSVNLMKLFVDSKNHKNTSIRICDLDYQSWRRWMNETYHIMNQKTVRNKLKDLISSLLIYKRTH